MGEGGRQFCGMCSECSLGPGLTCRSQLKPPFLPPGGWGEGFSWGPRAAGWGAWPSGMGEEEGGEAPAGEERGRWNKCLGLQGVKRVLEHLRHQPAAPKAWKWPHGRILQSWGSTGGSCSPQFLALSS